MPEARLPRCKLPLEKSSFPSIKCDAMVDTDDEDLRQQAKFLESNQRPSAKFTRIGQGKQFKGAKDNQNKADDESGSAAPTPTPEAFSIVGEVVERQSTGSIKPPTFKSANLNGFPVASKTAMSKFRRRQQTHNAEPQPSKAKPLNGTAGAHNSEQEESRSMDQKVIHEENVQAIAGMSPDEIAEAQKDILAALSPASVEFLRKRSKSAAGQDVQRQPKAATDLSEAMGSPHRTKTAGQVASQVSEALMAEESFKGAGQSGLSNTSEQGDAKAGARARIEHSVRSILPQKSPPKAMELPVSSQEWASNVASNNACSPADLMPESEPSVIDKKARRARFAIHQGKLVGFADDDKTAGITQRDVLRYTGEEGYTIREACILARSTHPGQQRAACMLLSAVICRASPFQADKFDDGPTAQNNKNEKFWRELWDVILHKEPLVASLRLLLDSDESMVLSAAIAALSQLTRPIAPATSLHGGLPWFEHLSYSRARPDLPWEGFSHKGKDEVAEQDEQENSDDWNLHDELLSTNILPRIASLLKLVRRGSEHPRHADVAGLLDLLLHLAGSSKSCALSVLKETSLMRFLTSEMLTMEGVSGSNPDWKLSVLTKIVSILRLTCFLERPEVSQVLSDVEPFLGNRLLTEAVTGPYRKLQAACLDFSNLLWTQWHRPASTISFDDLYPCLCRAFTPDFTQLAHQEQHSSGKLQLCCSTWQFATAALRPFDGHALISAECASALLRHALENLNSLAAALSDLTYWPDTKSSANQYQDLWRLKPGLMVAQCTAGFLLQACQDAAICGKEEMELIVESLQNILSNSHLLSLAITQDWPEICSRHKLASQSQITSLVASLLGMGIQINSRARNAKTLLQLPALGKFLQTQADKIVEIASKAEWPSRLGPEDLQHLQAALPSFELFVNTARLLQATDPSEDRNSLAVEEAGDLQLKLLHAFLCLPRILPPGAEALALDVLTYAFSPTNVALLDGAVQKHLEGRSLQLQLPEPLSASQSLLAGFAVSYLRLRPEKTSSRHRALAPMMSSVGNAPLQPVGSILPLGEGWLYDWGKICEDSSVLEEDLKPTTNQGLDTIPEDEPAGGSSRNKDRSGPSTASLCWLSYVLGLELVGGTHEKLVLPVPAGVKTKHVYSALFKEHSGLSESVQDSGVQPLIIAFAESLFSDIRPGEWKNPSSVSTLDVEHWAAEFAQTLYGERVLSQCLGLFLLPDVSEDLKVTILTTLADEGGLHLLCPHRCSAVEDQTKEAPCPSLDLSEQLVDLLVKGCFRKARQSDSEVFKWMVSTLKRTFSPEGLDTLPIGKDLQMMRKLRSTTHLEVVEVCEALAQACLSQDGI